MQILNLNQLRQNLKNAETLSEPLVLSKTDNDQVPVNGIAMAPYMISFVKARG